MNRGPTEDGVTEEFKTVYDAFYGFQKKPFSLRPDPELIYLGARQRKILAMLRHGVVSGDGFTVLVGDIGCGKTTLSEHLERELAKEFDVGVINNTHQALERLETWVLRAFNVTVNDGSEFKVHDAFRELLRMQRAKDRKTLLVIDEAHNLPVAMLEQLRLLANANVEGEWLRVFLVGQLQLVDTLRRPELRQFAQRISVGQKLGPLERGDTGEYIKHRVRLAGGDPELFESQACDVVHDYSQGVPRGINALCDTALVHGYQQAKRRIDEGLMQEVVTNNTAANFLGCEAVQGISTEPIHHSPVSGDHALGREPEPDNRKDLTLNEGRKDEIRGSLVPEISGRARDGSPGASRGNEVQRSRKKKRSLDEILRNLAEELD